MIDGFPGTLIFHQRMRGTSLEFINDENEHYNGNFTRQKPMAKYGARGKYNPEHPNYVACFIPYTEKDKAEMEIPDFSKADKIRYTMMRGYTESKQFYSPDYSRDKPDENNKDFRRTLLWTPTAKSDTSGSVTLSLFNNSDTKYLSIDIQGRGEKSIYGNAANINTRERKDSISEATTYMEIWKKLSKTELPPTIITRCNNLTRDGVIYYVNREYEKAIKNFREAARYGYAPALANFGKCYYDGKGVNENKRLGMRYFEMAANKGNNLAMHHLGDIFYKGEIVPKNDSLAHEYYKKAAENNFAGSQRMMGEFHEKGIFVEKDLEKALKWYNLAALQNDPDALYKVGAYIVKQDSIKGLSKRQLRKSQAISYMRKAARGGNIEAQRFIVKCFAEGKYLKKSRKKSFEWMKSIAELGNEEALMFVAYCYEKGRGTDVNHPLAYKLYKQLAEKGNEFAIAKVYEFEMLRFFMYNSPKPPGVK